MLIITTTLGDNTYYVSSSINDCPTKQCHPLSYYITDTATYFTSNATFIFMEGEHLLDSKGLVQVAINDVESLTLRGERDRSNTVKCGSNTRGIVFNNTNMIEVTDITITGCGQWDIPPLLLINIIILYIHHIKLYNNTYNTSNSGGTLYIECVTDTHIITITNSTFTNNRVGGDGGGLFIYSDTNIYNNITITNSTFINNTIDGNGGGLYIYSNTDIHNNITITNSIFTITTVDGDGGGLLIQSDTDIHNDIAITNSVFTSNTASGDGGGLFKYSGTNIHNNIIITNSIFTSNTVDDFGGGLYIFSDTDIYSNITITNSTLTNNRVSGDGGGLFKYSDTDIHNNIAIINSAFANNTVDGIGGGLYIQSQADIHNNIIINNNAFANNAVKADGGGLYIFSDADIDIDITITNSSFTKNTIGRNGGGLYIYSDTDIHNNITIINSTFTKNAIGGNKLQGGLVALSYTTNVHFNNITVIKSSFTNNCAYGLVLVYATAMLSQVMVSDNNNSGLLAIDHVTVVFTEGHSIIANNSSPIDGGGIYLSSISYLTTRNGGHVSFINNTAHRYGGAIYSPDDDYISLRYGISKYNYEQCTVYNLSATFINNSAAIAGDLLYGGVFMFCQNYVIAQSIYTYLNYLLQCPKIPNSIKNVTSLHQLSPVSSDPLIVCLCVNDTVDYNITSLDKEVYPGQILNVSLVTVGLCGGVSPGTVVVRHGKQIKLISSSTTDYTSTSCTTLNYNVKLTTYISSTNIELNIPDGDIYGIDSINVHLTILSCPLGLVLNYASGDCVCNRDISHISGVICNISWMPHPIQRSGNNWISHQYNYNCTIAHNGCPFDYCKKSYVKINLNESDFQCNYNRSGILCGQCIQGLSLMIGSNRCANCTDITLVSVSIFVIAAVAGIVLVILLIVLNLTVSVGSINGLLFYTNLVKLNESVFFSQGNIPVITQFISWCNLDIGFEYCFIHGLDGYVKTWLQFVFPVYLWVLVIVIIIACRYSGRLSRLTGHNAVPVLATLILMSYTKLSRTITNALMMNTLQCREYKWNVWNIDGNISYLSTKHTILLTVALLFLVIGLVYTGLVFSSQWLQRYSGKCCKSTRDPVVRLKPLIDAYTGPFKDKYRFWTGLCLIVRFILTVVFSFTTTLQSKLNNYILLLTVGAMSIFVGASRAYKDKHITALEIFSFLNLKCLSFLTILFTDLGESHIVSINVIVSVSVSIEMLLFAIIIIVHCCLAFKKVFPNFKLSCCKTCVPSEEELPLIAGDIYIEETSPDPAHIITYREELIFDFYLNEEHP